MGPLLPTRRTWFASLAALLGTSITAQPLPLGSAPAAPAAPESVLQPTLQPILQPVPVLLQTSPVAGFQYHEGETVWALLRSGQALTMVREPGNRFDERAIRLDWQDQKIGYVPARDNAAVSQLLDRGERLNTVITQLRQANNPWDRIEFAVYWTPGQSGVAGAF
jgi:HIRAN domain